MTRTDLAPAPPDLAKGDYGFEATAYDAGDTVLASACVERSLPRTERVQIVLTSQTVSCPSAADGGADSGDANVDGAVEMGCGDRDQDGCDDCAYSSSPDPAADGPEFNGDGQCDCVVFADASVVGAGDGKRWATAFSRLQDAIDSAHDQGDTCEVWVRQGTYYSFMKSSADGVVLRRGIDLYGGFAGGELTRGQRSSDPSLTVIDGRSADSASLRVSHVLTGASDVLVEGFTIVGGDAAGAGDAGKGGGMFNFEADLTLRNLRFRVNHAALGGGALYNVRSNVLLARCTFEGNASDASGGAVLDETGTLTLRRCAFRDNQARDAQFGGGALYAQTSSVTVENSLFAKNTAVRWGGAILGEASNVRLTNCTLADNTSNDGGAVMGINGAVLTLKNSIVWDNASSALRSVSGATFDVSYSDVQGGYAGAGNIAASPLFLASSTGDYHLSVGSPCVDAAQGDAAPATDFDDKARVDASVADTGAGMPSYVDMGAYELSP